MNDSPDTSHKTRSCFCPKIIIPFEFKINEKKSQMIADEGNYLCCRTILFIGCLTPAKGAKLRSKEINATEPIGTD